MISELKPYPKYKATGQAWLGEIPEHWSLLPNRTLFEEVKDRNHPDEEMLSVTIKKGIVRQKTFLENSSKKDSSNLDRSAYKLVQPNYLAYNKMRAWQGAIGVSAFRGIISPAYVVVRLRNNHDLSRYFHYLFRTPQFAKEAERWSYGITSDMWSLRPEHFKLIYAPKPTSNEQAAIVRFLDWVGARLDRTILAKKRVIALLLEQKQVVICNGITRGTDLTHQLKNSGVSWLGGVPSHWEVIRSKYLFREVDMRSVTGRETHLSMSQRLGLVPNSQIRERRMISESYIGAKLCHTNDLVLNRLKAHLGVFALASEDGLVSPDYTVLRPIRDLDARYFLAIYRSNACRVELRKRAKGIVQGFWRLYTDDFYDIKVPVPPLAEQKQIIDHLENELLGLNKAIECADQEIRLLREYRNSLISDVVTGKLDVGEAAKRIPAEPQAEIVADDEGLGAEDGPLEEELVE